ncbi:putative protein phosphatase 2C 74 [Canna indica]|uniref:protein-serine/threonine phosphatase n=1 Tax=Canna indica TaxID=4628 RepID=A0AAQ3K763_9LILI|nr:putative protein phosphatase 2C 74 [Canna indica]
MVDPVDVQCSFCNLVHLFQVLEEYCTYASSVPCLPSKRLAELSSEANKRLKESPAEHCKLQNSDVEESCFAERVPVAVSSSCCGTEEEKKIRVEEMKGLRKVVKRPSKLFIPEPCSVVSGFAAVDGDGEKKVGEREWDLKGSGYSLACRRGNKAVMEDGYGVISNVNGDPKQALFGVFDGHGGRAAVDFVCEKLGKNIISALTDLEGEEDQIDLAVKAGYLTTDKEFISKGVQSGACVSTVLLKDGEVHIANVGDCRVVLSRKGIAEALTSDHHPGREDERQRIENTGGYVTCRNGVWRIQDSLAVSRSIGDASVKQWVIPEPEMRRVRLTPECELLVMASDGLWDKVTNQEAVDVVGKERDSMKACKELVELSCRRGSRDDITVMVVDLQNFLQFSSTANCS